MRRGRWLVLALAVAALGLRRCRGPGFAQQKKIVIVDTLGQQP